MRSLIPYSLLSVLFLISCGPGGENSGTEKKDHSAAIDSSIRGFISWYQTNYDKVNSYTMCYQGDGDTLEQYRINFFATEGHLSDLKASGFIADECIAEYRKFYLQCDSFMLVDKQMDGPPYGFEADMILCSQDPESSFEDILSAKKFSSRIENDKAYAKIGSDSLSIVLKQVDKKWKIVHIGCINL